MAWIFQTVLVIVLFTSVCSECVPKIYENTYFRGGDIAKVLTPTLDYCQIVCTYHPRCLLFSYLPGNGTENPANRFTCFLKDHGNQVLPKIHLEGITSGHSLKQCPQITACSQEVYKGLDLQGGTTYNVTIEDSYQHCQRRCTNEVHCQFFTYVSASNQRANFRKKCFRRYSTTGTPTQIEVLNDVTSGFSLKPCQLAETDCLLDIFQHTHFSGTLVARVFAPDAFVCRTICTYQPNCIFFTFYSSEWQTKTEKYICLMMTSESGMPDAIVESKNVLSGFSLLNCRKTIPACSSQTYPNLNFLGMDLNEEYVDGPKACQQLCTDIVRCQFFTYSPNQASCNREGKCKCNLRMSTQGSPHKIVFENEKISGYSLRLCQMKVSPVCVQKPLLDSRVVGGTNASLGEWPWQVSLHVKLSVQKHHCGGSIISDQWILTAAHCMGDLLPPDVWRVYTGILKQSQISEDTPFFKVQEVIVHPDYEISEEGYDIALMKLDRPMNFSDLQQALCLPANEDTKENTGYTNCWVTGWGYTKERGEIQDVLQKVNIPIITNAECQLRYRDFRIHNKMVCAGYPEGGKDACKGDSGGPLSCKHKEAWYLVGITSWGEGCARPGHPGVYTNVAEFVEWILEKIS
ncbi:plasma kallikrein isoform X2 [Eublepharis macularius]|uniref:Plasma kallikrein isoform X2 n=1 Tax=Eublepharis macularius TaxID=481883 RepID=A0AA97JV15_EUBMA|nr:plasma kallikrein isoform X2 [Eublepharis macularius]